MGSESLNSQGIRLLHPQCHPHRRASPEQPCPCPSIVVKASCVYCCIPKVKANQRFLDSYYGAIFSFAKKGWAYPPSRLLLPCGKRRGTSHLTAPIIQIGSILQNNFESKLRTTRIKSYLWSNRQTSEKNLSKETAERDAATNCQVGRMGKWKHAPTHYEPVAEKWLISLPNDVYCREWRNREKSTAPFFHIPILPLVRAEGWKT